MLKPTENSSGKCNIVWKAERFYQYSLYAALLRCTIKVLLTFLKYMHLLIQNIYEIYIYMYINCHSMTLSVDNSQKKFNIARINQYLHENYVSSRICCFIYSSYFITINIKNELCLKLL